MVPVLLTLIAAGAAVAIVERVAEHRERMRAAQGGYSGETIALAMRAAAFRVADPEVPDELIDAIVETVAQDLDDGTLVDPRPAA